MPDSVDRLFQQLAHLTDAFQRSMRKSAFINLPTPVLPASLATKFR